MKYASEHALQEYLAESVEHLSQIENELLDIEASGPDRDNDLVNKIFRSVHSIKGGAGLLGLKPINQLAHQMENVLGKIRTEELGPSAFVIDTLLAGIDTLRGMLGSPEKCDEFDVEGHVRQLVDILQKCGDSSGVSGAEPSDAPTGEEDGTFEPKPPSPSESPEEKPSKREIGASADWGLRVHTHLLTQLMNHASELVLTRNQLLQALEAGDHDRLDAVGHRISLVTSELQESIMRTRMQPVGILFNRLPRLVRSVARALDKEVKLTTEGEEVEVDKAILEGLTDPLNHLVRNAIDHGLEPADVRHRAGKSPIGQIRLRAYHDGGHVYVEVSDDGRGLDLERIAQKAADLGLTQAGPNESPSENELIEFLLRPGFSTASEVTELSGRGVGLDVVRSNLQRLGGELTVRSRPGSGALFTIKLPPTLTIVRCLIARLGEDRFAIPEANLIELVCTRGSGAENRIEQLNGTEVFRLRGRLLPLVPLGNLFACRTASPRPSEGDKGNKTIVVVRGAGLPFALVADGVEGLEEMVVKPLDQHLRPCCLYAGATIMGDGAVVLVLDMAGIAQHAALAEINPVEPSGEKSASDRRGKARLRPVLLFTNDPQEQFGVPIERIARVQRVAEDEVERFGELSYLPYRGSNLPLIALEEQTQARPRSCGDSLSVIVLRTQGGEVGLLTPRILDVAEIPASVDDQFFEDPAIVGSAAIGGKTTLLLNVDALASARKPRGQADTRPPVSSETVGRRVLVVEDSAFFRGRLTEILTDAGCRVRTAEDGRQALGILRESPTEIDLVLTDLEMPNMDGFELTSAIRGDAELKHLKVIALSSLAGEEDLTAGRKAGVDVYLVKLDEDELLETMDSLLVPPVQHAAEPSEATVKG